MTAAIKPEGSTQRGELSTPKISVVVTVAERPEPLEIVYEEYAEPLRGFTTEFIFVVAPQYAHLTKPLELLAANGEPIRVLQLAHQFGEATLLKVGAEAAKGDIVVTIPAYRRVVGAELPKLIERLNDHTDMIVARRWPRNDAWANRVRTTAFHNLIRGLAGNDLNDVASGVTVSRRDVLLDLPLYGDLARFVPLVARRAGYRVEEAPATQHPVDAQRKSYAPGVYLRRLIDVLGVFFVLRFTEKPLRFFGLLGAFLLVTGSVLLVTLTVQRFMGQGIANRPLLLLAVLLLVLGVQAIALGLIGEIIVHFMASRRRSYRLADNRSS